MIFFYWDKFFETGFDAIDRQHREFISLAEKLQDSIYSQNTKLFEKYSSEIQSHLENHFETENNLMTKHSFPGYFSHKAEHDRFYDKVKNNLIELNKKPTNDINLFFEMMYKWFKNHLDINDRKLTKFLIDNNLD